MRLLFLLLLAATTFAGTISRPVKPCGTNTYVDEVAAGCTTILASDVDGDLNTIYTGFNGNITTPNLTFQGTNCDRLIPASCPGSIIQNGTICTDQIGDGCIATVDLGDGSVTGPKLAVNSVVNQAVATGTVNNNLHVDLTEVVLVQTATFTSRNSQVMVAGTIALACTTPSSSDSATLTIRLYDCNGTFGCALDHTLVLPCADVAFSGIIVQMPVAVPLLDTINPGGQPGTFFKVTGQSNAADHWVTTSTAGYLNATEFR